MNRQESPTARLEGAALPAILRIVLPYVVFAGLWILGSDRLLEVLRLDVAAHTQWSIYKGWAFVLVTAGLLSVLLRAELTARARAQAALRSSEERLRSLGDNLPDSYVYQCTQDADGSPRFLYISAGVERLHGITAEDVLRNASRLLGQIAPEQMHALQEAEAVSQRELTDFTTELHMRHPDGTWRWMQLCSRPRRMADGRVLWDGVATDISVRKRAEAAMQAAEQRLASIIEFLPDATFVVNQDQRVTAWNQACEVMTGVKKNAMLGQGDFAYALPFYGERRPLLIDLLDLPTPELEATYQNVRRRHGLICAESYNPRLNGGRGAHLWVAAAALFDEAGRRSGAIEVIRDVTEQKRTEQSLRESEIKYRELVELANSIILRWTRDGRISFVNEFGLRFFGYSADEIIGRHVVGTIVPSTESGGRDLGQIMDQICADPKAYEQNINENMRRDGERVWIAWTNRVVLNLKGELTEILSVGTDITERKRTEEALRHSEEQFRLIMDNLADLVAVLDLDGRRLYNSPSYRSILGDPDHLRGSSSFDQIHPEDVDAVRRAFAETVRTGVGRRLDYRMVGLDGQIRHIESQGSVIRDTNHKVARVIVVSRDVTERRLTEEAIRELNTNLERRVAERTDELAVARDRAEAADRLKSAFLATMSHELRTPLNSIIGFTGILLQGLAGPLNDEQRKQLDMVRGSARHLLELINDVLDISKIEAGQLEVASQPFDLRASIEKVAGGVDPLARKKGLDLRVVISPAIGIWVSDQRRVEQILINLLNNAIKFTERGQVTLEAQAPQGTLRISVTDTGIGIRAEDLRKLFQPFRQIDTGLSRNHEGTGLGLAICRRLAGLLGGQVLAESEWGKGSTFTLVLPIEGGMES